MRDAFQPGGRSPAPPPLDLVQDFVNTEIPDFDRDDIATPELLTAWLGERGLLPATERATAASHRRACDVRRALRLLALAHARGAPPPPDHADQIDRALAAVPVRLVTRGGSVAIAPRRDGVDAALATILGVVMAAERDGSWERLKACVQHTCGWVFFDASRNRSSSWCSMRVCGNRTKVAAARRRQRSA